MSPKCAKCINVSTHYYVQSAVISVKGEAHTAMRYINLSDTMH